MSLVVCLATEHCFGELIPPFFGDIEMKRTIFGFTAAALLATGSASAAILVQDDFSTDGNLTGSTPDVGGVWTAHSGAGNAVMPVAGGVTTMTLGSGSREDTNSGFGTVTSGTLYYGFDMTVTSAGSSYDEYVAHFKDDGSDFTARFHIDPAGAGGDYTVGISGSSSSPDATWATDLSVGETYNIIVGFDFGTGVSTLWVDATSAASTSITSSADTVPDLEAFAFRQSSSGGEVITFDNLVVATTFDEVVPEPGSLALLGLGGLLIARRRRG